MTLARRSALAALAASTLLGAAACQDKAATTGAPAAGAPATLPVAAAKPAYDTAGAKQLIATGATVIDVREEDEWADGHLPTATLVPLGQVADRVAEIERVAGGKDKPVVLYCGSGGRAGKAKATLEAAGFTHVVNGGGYRALSTP